MYRSSVSLCRLPPFGHTGEWTDAATGLQYLRARWYDPATGRFTQVDPFPGMLSLPGTQHPYAYALNNPLRYTDPSGEFVQILGGAAAGAVIGAVAGGVSHMLRNPGKSLGEYVRDVEFRKALGTGAASGAVAGAVYAAIPLGLAALGLKAATAGGAAFIGWVSGSLAGAAGQITANLLTPCTKWHQGVRRAMFWGGLGGAAFGWAGWHVRQWWAARQYPQIKNGSAGRPTAGKHFPESVRNQAFAENPTQTCVYCRRPGTATHVGHAIPRSQGGNATFENAQLTCPWCNKSKGARSFPVNPPPAYKGPWPPSWWNQ